ncbi:MAG: MBL fold metallo-hydrolase [Cyanobacteria bacterium P01_A01_bin.123]
MTEKKARQVFETIFAFPPNRATLGGTAYLVLDHHEQHQPANILVDCPPWNDQTIRFIEINGGIRWLTITHRGAAGAAKQFQRHFQCAIVVQEQEAYLLPGCDVQTFHENLRLTALSDLRWTPGYSPGSSCLYHWRYGGVLFSGRHLLPTHTGKPQPIRFSKTFHWPRQLHQVDRLRTSLSEVDLSYICPGANTGFLRGNYAIASAHQSLQSLDLNELQHQKPLL